MFWSRPRAARPVAAVLVSLLAASALVACGSDDKAEGDQPGAPAAAGFPVTIKNVFGDAVVEKKPERIVTLGWNAQDIVYALGETPVGMPKVTYGQTAAGTTAWDESHFDPAKTTLFDTTDSIPFEKIAALTPDVILAPYEGFDKATYDKLSEIATTVAYPGAPWQTTWQDQTTIIGQALGKSAEAQKLVDGVKELTAKAASDHPEFKGKTITVASFGAENYVYMPNDPRVQILNEMGFVNSPGVEALEKANKQKQFYMTVSKEKVAEIDADVVVAYVDDLTAAKFKADPVYAALGASKKGSVYLMEDKQVVSGMSAVSVLSVPWVLEKILPGLTKAAEAAK